MAVDAWLLEQHRLGLSPPSLRFYTWSPATISLGYHQRQWPREWHQLNWQGSAIALVRRPTGGRAVLHQGDLTYAVITSDVAENRLQAYQAICEFLIQGWRSLGIELHYGNAGRGYIHNPNCFGTATGADLVLADGTKFIGSAQLRKGSAILQHGSMRLNPDPTLFAQFFGETLLPKLPIQIPSEALISTAIEALTNAARCCFEVEFFAAPLTEAEMQAAIANQASFIVKHPAEVGSA